MKLAEKVLDLFEDEARMIQMKINQRVNSRADLRNMKDRLHPTEDAAKIADLKDKIKSINTEIKELRSKVKNESSLTEGKFDTIEKQVKAIKTVGLILTFKKPIKWKGEAYKQIMIEKNSIRKENKKFCFSTPWYDSEWKSSLEELADLIDWKDAEKRFAFSEEIKDDLYRPKKKIKKTVTYKEPVRFQILAMFSH